MSSGLLPETRIEDLPDASVTFDENRDIRTDELDLGVHELLRVAATHGTSTNPGASDEDN
jgi:hypothetical protein